MTVGSNSANLTTGDLEEWLSQLFIPVEPNDRFIKRLKAKLIRIHGKEPFSGWMMIGTLAMALMILLTVLGFILRIVLLLLSIFGFIDRKRRPQGGSQLTVAGN